MCTSLEQEMQQRAMQEPQQAIAALGLTADSSVHTLKETLFSAYVQVNGGSPTSKISHHRVNEAVRLWQNEGKLEPWVARACVLKSLKSA